jgi:hypothetical protein
VVGLHEMVEYDRVAPPSAWVGLPVFVLKECVHCPHNDYDMEWPREGR